MNTSEMVFEYLKKNGLSPTYYNDNTVIFKYQMATFIYVIDNNDVSFFRIEMPEIYDVTEDNRIAVLEAINEVTNTAKVAKAYIPTSGGNRNVALSTEILIDGTPVLEDIIPRLLQLLMDTREYFYKVIS
jgi:hypothetical protein